MERKGDERERERGREREYVGVCVCACVYGMIWLTMIELLTESTEQTGDGSQCLFICVCMCVCVCVYGTWLRPCVAVRVSSVVVSSR